MKPEWNWMLDYKPPGDETMSAESALKSKPKKDLEYDHTPDYLYGVAYVIVRPEGGNPDGS